MVSVDMGVKDTGNLPTMLTCQIKIDLWIKGGINDECLLLHANNIGKAPFPRPSHLDDLHGTACDGNLSRIPGQTPCFHASLQGIHLESSCCKLFCRNLARFPCATHRDHRAISREGEGSECSRIMRFECLIRIDMQAPRNAPLGSFGLGTHIDDGHEMSFF